MWKEMGLTAFSAEENYDRNLALFEFEPLHQGAWIQE
jgi:hypothetical protein